MISILLGLIQGVGEFLPISSSAHLILIPYLFNFEAGGFTFDIALHFGTLIAIVIVFSKDYLNLLQGVFKKVVKKEDNKENRLFWYLVLATIPGAILGLLLEGLVEDVFRKSIFLIALFLGIMGVIIFIADKIASKVYIGREKGLYELGFKETFLIGLSQVIAIFPGFSRSGTTMVTGRILGASREATAKFSFLLSVPIIFGATILKLPDMIETFSTDMIIGIVSAAVFGILSIKFLLAYIKNHDFKVFAYYRLIISLAVIIKIILN